jgi:hypothetical protein
MGTFSGGLKTTKGHGLVAQTSSPRRENRDAGWNSSKLARLRRSLPQSRGAAHIIKASPR